MDAFSSRQAIPAPFLSGTYWTLIQPHHLLIPSYGSRHAVMTSKLISVSPLFENKKASVISALAIPDEDYTDLSPKGSVDAGIRSLIDQINKSDGAVTTSSCAGRISVFLEGEKTKSQDASDERKQAPVPGGKGSGGRWLFVSHGPVKAPLREGSDDMPITKLLGLVTEGSGKWEAPGPDARFLKFQFEPMILHIMTASLHHAQPILSAAIDAGFRESGVQSLKNLGDPNAFPMVAVRTAGLALGSIIGYLDKDGIVRSLVTEEYLGTLLGIANARFAANAERTQRFGNKLSGGQEARLSGWENPQSRSERKRAEGLKRKEQIEANGHIRTKGDEYLELDARALFFEASANGAP